MANEEIMQDTQIAEPVLVIGHNKGGVMLLNTQLNPAAAIALLESMKLSLLRQINFNKERLVEPVKGSILPLPNGNGNGKRF